MSRVADVVATLLPARADWEAARRNPGRDLLAGVTVAVVALPLALAFGVASGLGPAAGLTTAIVAGAIAAVLGGSNLQVSGPTGAMSVVLLPVVHKFGREGVLMVGLLAGVVLVVAAFARLGRLVRLLPVSLVEGFTAGIAVVIFLQQVPNALGVEARGGAVWSTAAFAAVDFFRTPHVVTLVVALAVAVLMLVGQRFAPRVPFSMVGVVLATLAVVGLHLDVAPIGDLPRQIGTFDASFVDLGAMGTLAASAVAVAALGALESLLSATVADGMTVDERHDPDRELFGQGIANVVTPFLGGVPATGAIARTAVNVRTGGRSRTSAFTHAVVLAVLVLAFAPLVGRIPLAALAGVLLATTIKMVEVGSLRAVARATRGDALVLVLTFVVTVAVNLVTAVLVGLAVAVVLALRSVVRAARVETLEAGDGVPHPDTHTTEELAVLDEHIVVYRFDGPLFFAAAHEFLLELTRAAATPVVVLRMSRVTSLDATGASVLGDAIDRLEARGSVVLLSGTKAHHDAVLDRLSVAQHLRDAGRVFADTPTAIAYARTLVGQRVDSRPEGGQETDTLVG
ncbi:sulfate permease [Luteimicrobium album]|uniref:Sulfate permease n=1 Tax=Luteimicrobium album TaxID=1054550 RepID=A0ABQ6I3M0_9MICO|nr:SulP family inorganic anion transporter [Luteimicrobium album]GMA25072.1 sulfate permease [Luteimicrobium album]